VDHFKCYAATSATGFASQTVTLDDQFLENKDASVVKPVNICNPVSKDGEPILHLDAHLVCYAIRDARPRFAGTQVETVDQFGTQTLSVNQPEMLCLPATKTLLP
jgi:hypothetical protein